MAIFFIKAGDTSPAIQGTLERPAGTPINLTGASVVFVMRKRGADVDTVNAAASLVTPASGVVKYEWQTGDTDDAGTYDAEWKVTFADGTIERVPNTKAQSIKVVPSIS